MQLDQVSNAAVQINEALAPLHKEADKATGSKKGAVTKHMNKVRDALLAGEEVEGDDAEMVKGVDKKNLDKAHELGNGLLLELLETLTGGEPAEDIRELAGDLCLRAEGLMDKADWDALIQWSLKVREMYLDIESRREDAR